MSYLDAALSYHSMGWCVLPAHSVTEDGRCSCGRPRCESPGKHPRVSWSKYQDTRPTEAELRRWWASWPDSNIAIVTGTISGLVVLDVDPRHGGDEALYDLGPLPETVTAITGGKGMHLYFRHPGYPVPSMANAASGLDRRGDGGIVIAPPSSHASGLPYEWEVGLGPEDVPLAPLPAIVERLTANGAVAAVSIDSVDPEALLALPGGIPEGRRNDTLTRLAGSLIGSGVADALVVMHEVNRRACRPPLADDEVDRIYGSILRREQQQRAQREALTRRLAGQGNGQKVAPLTDDDKLIMARQLWGQVGISDTEKWISVASGTSSEFILRAGGTDVRFGKDLSYANVKREIMSRLYINIPKMKRDEWETFVTSLLACVQKEEAGGTDAAAIVYEWIVGWAGRRTKEADPKWSLDNRLSAINAGPIEYEDGYEFRIGVLKRYLELEGEKLSLPAIAHTLRAGGAYPKKAYLGMRNGKEVRVAAWFYRPDDFHEDGVVLGVDQIGLGDLV